MFLFTISCKSQTITIEQLSQCSNGNCPNYSAVKDTNNLLNKFVGTWKGTSPDGRIYEFKFTKKNDFSLHGGKPFDMILGRFSVKYYDGATIINTLSSSDTETYFNGGLFVQNLTKYQMYYSGYAECNDKGYVYLSFPDPNNLNQMRLVFMQDLDIVLGGCSLYKTVMPDAKPIILTKQ